MVKWLSGEEMKTTIILEDAVYKKVVEEAVRKYGNTRSISTVVNDILKQTLLKRKEPQGWQDVWGFL